MCVSEQACISWVSLCVCIYLCVQCRSCHLAFCGIAYKHHFLLVVAALSSPWCKATVLTGMKSSLSTAIPLKILSLCCERLFSHQLMNINRQNLFYDLLCIISSMCVCSRLTCLSGREQTVCTAWGALCPRSPEIIKFPDQVRAFSVFFFLYNNSNNSCIALYPVKIYKLAMLYIINIKIRLTVKKVQGL